MTGSVYLSYDSPVGVLYLVADEKGMLAIGNTKPEGIKEDHSSILQQCLAALKEYFSGNRKSFEDILSLLHLTVPCFSSKYGTH